ncbi:increased DNA methylation 1-like [Olea europaea subsp. europaea]|uniref:Increased DNA methylation 1-like n=1 Tax=Olea europaea subsp. europaea TaxID=158383 RepID=A0A8S0PED1_OLEEU|nr:increased DNA methylation 1-like [Olea europaea subsp. europaea]
MAGKSKRWMNQSSCSSSSSSGNVSDPDYGSKFSQRRSKQNDVTSHSDRETENVQIENNSSQLKRKRGRSSKKCNREIRESLKYDTEIAKDKPSLIDDEDSCAQRTRRFTSRRRRKSDSEIHQCKQLYASTSNRSSIDDYENPRCAGGRKRSSDDKNEKGKMKATVFSWLIDTNIIQENAEVFSVDDRSKQMKNKGIIKRGGILCPCCDNIFTAAAFHIHGGRNCKKPYESIFLAKKQQSLFNCMIEAWNEPDESQYHKFNIIKAKSNAIDLYDDACMICADGGNLICCERCYSTYHQVCVGMEEVPEGSWYCPYCVCKFCGDPAQENDYLITCPQCEKKYHWECRRSKERGEIDLNCTTVAPFCLESSLPFSIIGFLNNMVDKLRCYLLNFGKVHYKLSKVLVGKKNELKEGYSWTLLHLVGDGSGVYIDDVSGVYIDDEYRRTMCHSKLAVARRLMEECFEPIRDRHTRIKVIPSVVYNCRSNFNRIHFGGFYTAVLEKEDEIISVASLRIHGSKLAEMPFVATSDVYRCKGMCRKLIDGIESALRYLNVENLIIPSIEERVRNWCERYGFGRLEESMKQEIMGWNTLMFHDSIRLQKPLLWSSHFAESHREHNECSPSLPAKLERNNICSFRFVSTLFSLYSCYFCCDTSKSAVSAFPDLNLEPSE